MVEALVLFAIGIALPTWDVGSDITLSYSFLVERNCTTWEDYVRDYKDGIEPPVNQTIGKFESYLFKDCCKMMNYLKKICKFVFNVLFFRQILQL